MTATSSSAILRLTSKAASRAALEHSSADMASLSRTIRVSSYMLCPPAECEPLVLDSPRSGDFVSPDRVIFWLSAESLQK